MNDEATIESTEDKPVALVKSATLEMILGRIEADGSNVVGKPAGNNTRWVFDVEGEGGKDIRVRLLEFRGKRRLKPDLMSYSLAALSVGFYGVLPVATYEDGVFTIVTEPKGRFACRVSIDVMHSATR
jgi:hypothetical protein